MSSEFIDNSLPTINKNIHHQRGGGIEEQSITGSSADQSARGPSFYTLIKELRVRFPTEPKRTDEARTVEKICHETGERISTLGVDRARSTSSSTPTHRKNKGVSFSPQTLAIYALIENSASDLDDLLNRRVIDINELDEHGETLIHRAAQEGDIDCIRVLVNHGADVNIRNKEGWSPVHSALRNANLSAMVYLIECGADMEAYTRQRVEEFRKVERISKQVYKEEEVFV